MSILPTTFPPNNVSPRPLFHLDQTAPFAHLPCESGENKIGLSVMETLYLERVAVMVVLWSACSPITLMIRVQSRYFLLRNCLKRGHSWTLHWGNWRSTIADVWSTYFDIFQTKFCHIFEWLDLWNDKNDILKSAVVGRGTVVSAPD